MDGSELEIRLLNMSDAGALWHIRLEALEREPQAFKESAAENRRLTATKVAPHIAPAEDQFGIGAFVNAQLVRTLRYVRNEREKRQHRGSIHDCSTGDDN